MPLLSHDLSNAPCLILGRSRPEISMLLAPLDFKPELAVGFVLTKLSDAQLSVGALRPYPTETMMNATGHV